MQSALQLDKLTGLLLGTAVGDALGLPREGLSRRRARRLFGGRPLHHSFFIRKGMVSDDTEHACFVGQALLCAPNDPDQFARALAWRLRWWLLGIPAGVGFATLRATLKLWLGFPVHRSGVFSAGNGPAMRAPLLGLCYGDDPNRLHAYIRASTRLTHTDPKAERGALLTALAAHYGAQQGPAEVRAAAFLKIAREQVARDDDELARQLESVEKHLQRAATPAEFAAAVGLARGVTGYIYHTMPIAIYCWLRYPGDFRTALEEGILLGGDTDTVGAIIGALAGATAGATAIPGEWLEGIFEWPRSVAWMKALADRLAKQFSEDDRSQSRAPVSLFWPGLLPRNLFFLLVVLAHIVRRLGPPY